MRYEEQLSYRPQVATRKKYRLDNLTPGFEAIPPVWQLKVGDYRVFYDVDKEDMTVYVRAVRKKPAEKRTEDIT